MTEILTSLHGRKVGLSRHGRLVTNLLSDMNQTHGGIVYSATAASTAVTATSSETAFSNKYTIPANSLVSGMVLRVRFQGIVTAANSTDTLTIKAYLGGLSGTALVTSSATDASNNDIFEGEATITIRTDGASGTFVGTGKFTKVEAASGTATEVATATASTAIDTTATQDIAISATWSTNNAGNSCRLDILNVEVY